MQIEILRQARPRRMQQSRGEEVLARAACPSEKERASG